MQLTCSLKVILYNIFSSFVYETNFMNTKPTESKYVDIANMLLSHAY